MFRELGLPSDDDWPTRGPDWIDTALRDWFKRMATGLLETWEDNPTRDEKSILRLDPDLHLHLAVMSVMALTRSRLDQELLVLAGQAEELGVTWTAVGEALTTSPQNAHKVFSKRLMAVRDLVAAGFTVQEAVERSYYRRRQ